MIDLGDGYNSELIYIMLTNTNRQIIGHCTLVTETLKLGHGITETAKLLSGDEGTGICGEIQYESMYRRIGELNTFERKDEVYIM